VLRGGRWREHSDQRKHWLGFVTASADSDPDPEERERDREREREMVSRLKGRLLRRGEKAGGEIMSLISFQDLQDPEEAARALTRIRNLEILKISRWIGIVEAAAIQTAPQAASNEQVARLLRLRTGLTDSIQVRGLPSMRKILISLGACVSPVLSAFLMLFIMASMYAQVHPMLKGTRLHFKSQTAERNHDLCVGVGEDWTHAARPGGAGNSRLCQLGLG
jgi:hypothetical protein